LVLRWAMGNSNSQDSSRPGLGGSHHLPHYSLLCASPWEPHSNDILSPDSQMGVLKLPRLGLPQLWGPITLCVNLRLKWGLKQSCSTCQELSNGMSHAICTQGTQVDSRFLVIRSQTAILTPDPPFGHTLCFICPNGLYKLILDIYVPRAFPMI